MQTYKKRIAFLISDQHLIVHGGIGQFAKGFLALADSLNWKVDIIMDKAPTNPLSTVCQELKANIVYPQQSLKYSSHTGIYAFSDSINFEKCINFRDAFMQALSNNIYDLIVANSFESMIAVQGLDLSKMIPVVFYTHEESMVFLNDRGSFKSIFSDSCIDLMNKMLLLDNIYVGTQSSRNAQELQTAGITNAVELSLPLTEKNLLIPEAKEGKGVLFIGRWEERKNPVAFIKAIRETKLPAKVMTNSTGAKKFEKAFQEAGITDYEIKSGIVGQEKVDFIKSCKVHFNPALRESYGLAFLESLGHLPCVTLDFCSWAENFDSKFYLRVKKEDVNKIILKVYDIPRNKWYERGSLEYIQNLDNRTTDLWNNFVNSYVPSKISSGSSAKINEVTGNVRYSDFIQALQRASVSIEDIKSVLTNRHKFHIIYTDMNSYLSKDANFVPKEADNDLDIFGLYE
jgi:glycosyltransferase involved in cell wall biosynthesis